MNQVDPEIAHYVALGESNAEAIKLFERFCRNVRVEVMGGIGMIEVETGLPIGHRMFRCAYAPGPTTASMRLEDLAIEFYEQHCRGCAHRAFSGVLGRNIATVADARQAAGQVLAERERAEEDARLGRQNERSGRRARKRVGEPYLSVAQLERVDRLDPPGGSPALADVEWLVGTASLGAEVMSEATVDELAELARDPDAPWAVREAAQAVLVPLTAAGLVPEAEAVLTALANLTEGPGTEAGKLLVAAGNAVQAESVSAEVARSAVELAGRSGDPWALTMSRFSGKAVVADPAPLLLCAARNLETVLQVIERMLTIVAVDRQSPTMLVGPDGLPLGASEPTPDDLHPGAADRPRSIAAAACLPLIQATPGAAPRIVTALAGSLEIPDQDKYDAPPSKAVGRTLGLALLDSYEDVAPSFDEVAHRISEEARLSLFEAVGTALNARDENNDPATGSRIVQLAVDRLQGDWGEQVATEAALTLRELARFAPQRLEGWAGSLVGALVVEISRPAVPTSGLAVPADPLSSVMALGRRQRRQTRINCLRDAIGYLVEAGADEAVQALFSLLDAEDDGSPDAVSVRAAATGLLGKIGLRPVHLPAVVPRLYTGLLHADAKVRMAGIKSWLDLADQPQPLPSTLLDLLPVLLADGSILPSAMKLITRLDIPAERRDGLMTQVSGIALAAHRALFDGAESFVDQCIRAVRSLAVGLPDQEAEAPTALGLILSDRISVYDQRSLLLSWWPQRVANSKLFAERALSVLASPELVDYFNMRDYRVQAALLSCPYGTSLQPLARFTAVAELHLPDHPWPALEVIEILQRAGRWQDAAEAARHIVGSTPNDREHEARLELVTAIAEIAAGEARLGLGTVPAVPAVPTRDGAEEFDAILSQFCTAAAARQALREASSAQPPQRLTELADQLELAADTIYPATAASPSLPTESAWAVWAGALRSAAHLLRWDAATQDASDNADRHVLAARRRAETALSNAAADVGRDPLLQPLAALNAQIAVLQQPRDVAAIAKQLGSVPLPVRIVETRVRPFTPPAVASETGKPDLAVGICRLDGTLVTNAHVLRPNEVHNLTLEIRITDWPEEASAIEATFLSVLSPNEARLPTFTFPRTSPDDDGVYRLSATGPLSVSYTLPAGAPPQAFPIAARFTGPDVDEVLPIAGHSELRLRPFDATTDALTRRPQLDERVVRMYSVLHGMDVNPHDVQAFCRLYTAIVDKAVDMQFDRAYRRGAHVTERAFHDDLFNRLLADPALEGRVERGNRTAGGFLDIIHDRINAELKVARQTAVTVETSHKYLGQPTDYAADTGSQLSILVVLDMTQKQLPPGVLENYLDWMKPALFGLDDPRYPSLVGVIIINGNLPVPSGYSRGKGGPALPAR